MKFKKVLSNVLQATFRCDVVNSEPMLVLEIKQSKNFT